MKKPKVEKYYDAEKVTESVEKILSAYPEKFTSFSPQEVKCLFKTEKDKPNKKPVTIRFIKEPMSILTNIKILIIVGNEWWKNEIESERVKMLIEALTSIAFDKNDNLTKRDFDIKTFAEFLNQTPSFSQFSKVLPGEKTELVLEA